MDPKTIETKKARRSEISKGTYQREKLKRDRVLIRLDKGQAAILDAFCEVSGISRSAFFRSQLDACIRAASERPESVPLPKAKAKGKSKPKATADAPLFLASEFDELFGSKGA